MTGFNNFLFFMKSLVWQFVSWITRPVNLIMKAGLVFVILGLGGMKWASFDVGYISEDGRASSLSIEANADRPFVEFLMLGVGITGVLMVLGEVFWIVKRRRKILNIAIEHSALRDKMASPLINHVSKEEGGSDTLPIDLAGCYANGVVRGRAVQKALDITVVNLRDTLSSQIKQAGTKDVTVHYGGTAPVGLGFLAGFMLGNTSDVTVWDYNRNSGEWYKLAGYADSNIPVVDWVNYAPGQEVCIIMEISHPIDIEDIQRKMPSIPYVKVSMSEIRYDNMSSKEKVTAFQEEFGEMLKKLNTDRVERVHIFCAAQASFNFCMGRQITKNHPSCIVYEYQNSEDEKYPWGVLFNTKDNSSPAIS